MSVNSGSSLEQQRQEFAHRRLIATPLAGLIAWSVVAVCFLFMDSYAISITLFIATGSIVYLALPISKLTGEDFLNKQRPKNTFDTLFYYTIGMSVLVYAIVTLYIGAIIILERRWRALQN